jgi:hypothetical protein
MTIAEIFAKREENAGIQPQNAGIGIENAGIQACF